MLVFWKLVFIVMLAGSLSAGGMLALIKTKRDLVPAHQAVEWNWGLALSTIFCTGVVLVLWNTPAAF